MWGRKLPSFSIYFEKIFDAHAETVFDLQGQWREGAQVVKAGIKGCREIEDEQDMKLFFGGAAAGETGVGGGKGPVLDLPL